MAIIVITEDIPRMWMVEPDEYAKYDHYDKLEVSDEEKEWVQRTVAEHQKLQNWLDEKMDEYYDRRKAEREAARDDEHN